MIIPENAPNPKPKNNINFPNCGTSQIFNGISGLATLDSTNTNTPHNSNPTIKQKIIYQVFHPLGAFAASLRSTPHRSVYT
jgi:hypothetical protein